MKIGYVNLFTTTAADGSAQAVFPGGLNAEGATPIPVALPATVDHAVTWTRGPGGAVIGQLAGAYNSDPGNTQEMILGVQRSTGAGGAAMNLQADDAGNGSITLSVPGAGALTLINNLGRSRFLQLAGDSKLVLGTLLDFDSGAVAAGAGGSVGPFNHDLPTGFSVVTMLGMNLSIAGGETINWSVNFLSPTQIGLAYREVAGLGGHSLYRGCAVGLY